MGLIKLLNDPHLVTGGDPSHECLNRWFLVKDKINSIQLPGCKITYTQYNSKNLEKYLENYYRREQELESKYRRWLEEVNVFIVMNDNV